MGGIIGNSNQIKLKKRDLEIDGNVDFSNRDLWLYARVDSDGVNHFCSSWSVSPHLLFS